MSVITKGKTFANGEQLTAGKLNQMLDAAVFSSAAVDNTKTTLSGGAITIAPNGITATEIAQSFLDTIYPIGSIYSNASNSANPATLLGFGTWVRVEGKVIVGYDSDDDDFDAVGSGNNTNSTTGSKTHTLTTTEIPPHYHTYTEAYNPNSYDNGSIAFTSLRTSNTGNGNIGENGDGTGNAAPHNNLQPYYVAHMWRRTA
jgi:hypothetical protein